ncbi:ATP-binding protein [Leifsonia tongyongensis]|uniref:ATP-binding protein n=1 Tax=Leifsonia tongyongensis TaxID=1268043 RepID=UPI001878CC95|nr:ATP-binding protein [Diaminobutyricibacter tongyongensis]
MSAHPEIETLLERVARADAVGRASGHAAVVLIDGPAGAGKSTLADLLVSRWPGGAEPTLVRMDDLYPGWGGLDEGSADLGTELLAPRRAGRTARWQRYSWTLGRLDEWTVVDGSRPLVVEGCGTLSRANAPLADLRIWLTAEDDLRKERALRRDHGGFDAHWDHWQAQFDDYLARETPIEQADVVLDVTDWPLVARDR